MLPLTPLRSPAYLQTILCGQWEIMLGWGSRPGSHAHSPELLLGVSPTQATWTESEGDVVSQRNPVHCTQKKTSETLEGFLNIRYPQPRLWIPPRLHATVRESMSWPLGDVYP